MKPTGSVLVAFEPRFKFRRLALVAILLVLFSSSVVAQIPFAYTNDNGQITITKYLGEGGAVIIPDIIGDLPVTRIGNSAFFQSTWQLTEVTIPNSVLSIGNSAFESCTGLTNVTIGNNVTDIGNDAFAGCALDSIVVPDSVVRVGDRAFFSSTVQWASIGNAVSSIGLGAFAFCSNLKNITIGRGVTSIGDSAFGYCPLEGVYFKGNAPDLPSPFDFEKTIVYYLPGATGWGPTLGGSPVLLWNPTVTLNDPNFGMRAGQFGFTITGTSNLVVVVEASPDPSNPVWTPVATNKLTGGSSTFSQNVDNAATQLYRLRSPL
jgi:hypothetical protein